MIDIKDVVTLRVPFPSMNDQLAQKAHMYICVSKDDPRKELVKCQTFKVSMVTNSRVVVTNWIKEYPDISRNPFKVTTLIDLDKRFQLSVILPYSLLAYSRRNICDELYCGICCKLDKCELEIIADSDIRAINIAI